MENKILNKVIKPSFTKKSEIQILKALAKKSSKLAVRESRALGLTIKLIINNELVEKLPSGEIIFIRKLDSSPIKTGLKKGDVLCRKK